MDKLTEKKIHDKIKEVESFGHGEVIIKIRNGHVYRTIKTEDELEVKDAK